MFGLYPLAALLFHGVRPTLAICGAFQLLAQVHGGEVAAMSHGTQNADGRVIDTDTPLPEEFLPSHRMTDPPGGIFERGFVPVHITVEAPLFRGISRCAYFYELHGGEIKRLPENFSLLAESKRCGIQAIGHRRAPVFGVQFHPEVFDEDHPDGRRLLENFFRFAASEKNGIK